MAWISNYITQNYNYRPLVLSLSISTMSTQFQPQLLFYTPKTRYFYGSNLVTRGKTFHYHYDDVIMTMLASQISSLPVVCSIVYSDVNQRKHQSSASLAFVREIHRGPVNFPHKWPGTRKMFPFDDVIMDNGRTTHRGSKFQTNLEKCFLKKVCFPKWLNRDMWK